MDGTDYTATNGTTVTLTVAAQSGDNVVVLSFASFQVADALLTTGGTMTGDLNLGANSLSLGANNANSPQILFENSDGVTGDAALSTYDDASGTMLVMGSNFYINSSGSESRFNTSEESSAVMLNRNGDLNLLTGGTGATATTRLKIDSSGKVGIGVTPSSALHIAGAGTNNQLKLERTGDGTGSYYIAATENSLVFMSDLTNERMRLDSSGAVTMPAQPAFLARPASNQSNLPINATTTIAFGTEIFDQNADFNNSTNIFTAPVTGKYLLTTGLYSRSLDHDTSYYQLELATSNRVYYDIISMSGFDADVAYYEFKICVLADMDAGDTAFVRMGIPNNGSAQVQIDTVSNFSGHLVA